MNDFIFCVTVDHYYIYEQCGVWALKGLNEGKDVIAP